MPILSASLISRPIRRGWSTPTQSVKRRRELRFHPTASLCAIALINGTDKVPGSPFHNENGLLEVWTRNGTQLAKAGELTIGKWCQGIAWSANSKTLLVQCMVEEEITVVRFSGLTGRSLQKMGTIKLKNGPAGIRTAEP